MEPASGMPQRVTYAIPAPHGASLHAVEHVPEGGTARGDDGDRPTIVLAHGWTLSNRGWDRVVEEIRRRDPLLRVVTYDQRGHGRSTMGRAEPSVRMLGEDLAAVLRVVRPEGPLVLGGHSMGGMTVMAYAGQHPTAFAARVRRVALVATAESIDGRKPIPLEGFVMKLASRAPRFGAGPLTAPPVQARMLFGEGARREDVQAATRIIARCPMPTIGRFHAALLVHDERASLEAFRGVPTTVLVGTRDRLTPASWGQRLAQAIPGADLVVLPGLGHMLPYEATAEVVDALLSPVRHPA